VIDPGLEVRQAYVSLLQGNIIVDTVNIPVYDMIAPQRTPRPYIVVTEQTNIDDGCKGRDSVESTVLFEIETNFNEGYGGQITNDNIAIEMFILIGKLSMTNYVDVHGAILENTTSFKNSDTDGSVTIIKQIRLRHKVSEN